MKLCDLHTHSLFSDGSDYPEKIIDLALEKGLCAVALCDHNTVNGLAFFLAAAEGKPIEAIPGAEFSVDYHGKELHLLGLFLSREHWGEIRRMMESVIESKCRSNRELIASLRAAGYDLDYDRIASGVIGGVFNRAHVAGEMLRMGYVSTRDEAFDTVLSPKAGYYKEPKRIGFWEMLEYLSSIGAVPVLAHPLLNLSEEELRELAPLARERGLLGMECYYSTYDEKQTALSLEIAGEHGLYPSGGSDYHGKNKPDICLGSGKGGLRVPMEWAMNMKKRAK